MMVKGGPPPARRFGGDAPARRPGAAFEHARQRKSASPTAEPRAHQRRHPVEQGDGHRAPGDDQRVGHKVRPPGRGRIGEREHAAIDEQPAIAIFGQAGEAVDVGRPRCRPPRAARSANKPAIARACAAARGRRWRRRAGSPDAASNRRAARRSSTSRSAQIGPSASSSSFEDRRRRQPAVARRARRARRRARRARPSPANRSGRASTCAPRRRSKAARPSRPSQRIVLAKPGSRAPARLACSSAGRRIVGSGAAPRTCRWLATREALGAAEGPAALRVAIAPAGPAPASSSTERMTRSNAARARPPGRPRADAGAPATKWRQRAWNGMRGRIALAHDRGGEIGRRRRAGRDRPSSPRPARRARGRASRAPARGRPARATAGARHRGSAGCSCASRAQNFPRSRPTTERSFLALGAPSGVK